MVVGALAFALALTAASGAVLRAERPATGGLPQSPGPNAERAPNERWTLPPLKHTLPMSPLPWEKEDFPSFATEPEGSKNPPMAQFPAVERSQHGSLPEPLEDLSGQAAAQGLTQDSAVGVSTQRCQEEFADKHYDIIVYGANGFVGRMAAKYLVSLLPSAAQKSTWVAADRRPKELTETLASIFRLNENETTNKIVSGISVGTNLPKGVLGVRTDDVQGMLNMARHAKVVLSFAGPYESQGGEELIRAAINGCAHYVDISTEVAWQAKMQKKYDFFARARGVALVQSAGFHSMAADMVAVAVTRALTATTSHADPEKILLLWSELNTEKTGGQIKSEFVSQGHGLIADPYVLAPETRPDLRVDVGPDGFADWKRVGTPHGWGPILQMALMPLDATTNPGGHCPVVRRSMLRLFPDKAVSVMEAKNASLDTHLYWYKRDFRRKGMEDKLNQMIPGRGPPVWLRQAGSAQVSAYAYPLGGPPEAVVSMRVRGDPASVATPRMAVELALGLADKGPLNGEGGCLTPATAIDFEDLQGRLVGSEKGALIEMEKWSFAHD